MPLFGQILSDGSRGWIATSPDSAQARGTLTPLGSGHRVRLPPGFAPFAVMRGVAVGQIGSRIVTVDVATGRLLSTLGSGTLLATGHDAVLWTQR